MQRYNTLISVNRVVRRYTGNPHSLRRITSFCVMAFRVLARFSSLPSRNVIRIYRPLEDSLQRHSYSNGSLDTTDIQPEQPTLRYT